MKIILFFFFFIIPLVVLMFALFGLPIWAIIDCATSSERKSSSKTAWIIVMFLTFGLGTLVYGIVATQKKSLRITSIVVAVIMILTVVGSGLAMQASSSWLASQINQSVSRLGAVDTTSLPDGQLEVLKKDLLVLSEEARLDWRHLDRTKTVLGLFEYFELMTQDAKFDAAEYEDWVQKFSIRNSVKNDYMQKLVAEKKSLMAAGARH